MVGLKTKKFVSQGFVCFMIHVMLFLLWDKLEHRNDWDGEGKSFLGLCVVHRQKHSCCIMLCSWEEI